MQSCSYSSLKSDICVQSFLPPGSSSSNNHHHNKQQTATSDEGQRLVDVVTDAICINAVAARSVSLGRGSVG